MRIRESGMLFALVTAAACAGRTEPPATSPVRDGRYRYSETVNRGSSLTLSGEFVVIADTVIITAASPGPCQPSITQSKGRPISYRCAEVSLSFDRNDPVNNAGYSTVVVTQKPQRTCAEYGTDAQGRSVCVRYEVQMVDVKTTVGGRLRPERISAPVSSTSPK